MLSFNYTAPTTIIMYVEEAKSQMSCDWPRGLYLCILGWYKMQVVIANASN